MDALSLSFVPAVQELWNAWEIHFMILLSLSLQVFLFLFAGLRRHSSNWILQTVLWLAYLLADSVAVFVLGHMAVRAREPGHQLVAFWAPFVLVHLGGQDSITAFAKQDNDLWGRHLLNLVIQAGVAGYVVAKASWPDAWLKAAMVIMFVCECCKYYERVVCLYLGSKETANSYGLMFLWRKLVGKELHKKRRSMEEVVKDVRDTHEMMSKGSFSSWYLQWGVYQDARTIIEDIISVDAPLNKADNITLAAARGDILPSKLSEVFPPSSNTNHNINAYKYVGEILAFCYRILYTKDCIRFTYPSQSPSSSTTVASSIAFALFVSVHKRGQLHNSNRVDITVTYVLLVGAIVLDVCSIARIIFVQLRFLCPCQAKTKSTAHQREIPSAQKQCSQCQELGQYNIIIHPNSVFAKPLRGGLLKRKATIVTQEDHMSTKEFILDTLLASGTRSEWSIASTRGKLALQKWMDCHKHEDHNQQSAHRDLATTTTTTTTTTLKSLEEIITSSADFPTSVLVLHLATNICYYHEGDTTNSDHGEEVKKNKQRSKELSNYIMYLVFKCGVMLTTNSKMVHVSACRETEEVLTLEVYAQKWRHFFRSMVSSDLGSHKDDTLKLFDDGIKQQDDSYQQELKGQQDARTETKNEELAGNDDNASHIKELQMNTKTLKSLVLPRAAAVAQELIGIKDEAERWDLIAKVWAEMLYYTAPRCGGDFHKEHLSKGGGEFVTHVLLLMYYLGPFLPPPS